MALKLQVNGEWKEIGGIYKCVDGVNKPLSAIYQYINGKMIPIWEAGNLVTADGYIIVTKDNYIVTI
jgi:hypothetical protein